MKQRNNRNRDSSGHWKWGMIYHNPDDPKVWIAKRYGWGWTLNMARPQSWAILALLVLALLALVPLTT